VEEVMGRSLEEHRLELAELNCSLVGVSSQSQHVLVRLASRAKITYPLLSDRRLVLAERMRIPTIQSGEERLYQRLVFIARAGRVAQVFYRVAPLACASQVAQWLSGQTSRERDW
jgi:peroxiredoxin